MGVRAGSPRAGRGRHGFLQVSAKARRKDRAIYPRSSFTGILTRHVTISHLDNLSKGRVYASARGAPLAAQRGDGGRTRAARGAGARARDMAARTAHPGATVIPTARPRGHATPISLWAITRRLNVTDVPGRSAENVPTHCTSSTPDSASGAQDSTVSVLRDVLRVYDHRFLSLDRLQRERLVHGTRHFIGEEGLGDAV